jgi:pimeloyl-ACP methyl ester carboxylesterase
MQRDFSFSFQGREHDACVVGKDTAQAPNFVLIHGGRGSKERIHTYAQALEAHGISMLAFDQSGAGNDKENIKESSLEQRTNESTYAIEQYAAKSPLIIFGLSMGGEISVRLLERFKVSSLILLAPAIYDKKAYVVKFGEGFTDIIRTEDSWGNSASLEILEKFTGKLLILIGDADSVIPPGVIDALNEHSPHASKKEIYRIPGCPHTCHDWFVEHPDELAKVTQKIIVYSS